MISVNDKTDSKVPCVVCKEPIQSGAKVCINCSKSQNWLSRQLKSGATIVAALIAIISLVSGAQSLHTLIPSPASLKLSPMACAVNSIQVVVSNLGDRPGILRRLSLEVTSDNTVVDSVKALTPVKGSLLVEGGKTNVLTYVKKIGSQTDEMPHKTPSASSCVYSLTATTSDFENNKQQSQLTCPCPD